MVLFLMEYSAHLRWKDHKMLLSTKMLLSSLFLLTIPPSFIFLSPWSLLSIILPLNQLPFSQLFFHYPSLCNKLARSIQQYQKTPQKWPFRGWWSLSQKLETRNKIWENRTVFPVMLLFSLVKSIACSHLSQSKVKNKF